VEKARGEAGLVVASCLDRRERANFRKKGKQPQTQGKQFTYSEDGQKGKKNKGGTETDGVEGAPEGIGGVKKQKSGEEKIRQT